MSHTRVIRCERCGAVIGTIVSSGGGDATGLCAGCAEKESKRGGASYKGKPVEHVGRKGKGR